MKLSKMMHIASFIFGWAGLFALIGAWIAGDNGTFIGFSQTHLYSDAIVFELIAIAASVCVSVRMKLEKENPGKPNII